MLFKPYTHLAIVDEARADLIDDGKITIEQQSYTVPSDVVSAVRDFPEYFNAGAVGPDGFPDLVMGQSIIHPKDSGLWLQHVLSSARNWIGADKPQVLAWAYGRPSWPRLTRMPRFPSGRTGHGWPCSREFSQR